MIHSAKLMAVAEQPGVAEAKFKVAGVEMPAAEIVPLDPELSRNVQGAPSWLTVYVCPATVRVPVRGADAVLDRAVNCTSALPMMPLEVMLSHDALLDAVHEHAAGAMTPVEAPPPPAGTLPEDESSL